MGDHGRAPPIFDGHNDVLSRLAREGCGAEAFTTGRGGHLDAARAAAGGFGGGFFAIWVSSPGGVDVAAMRAPAYDPPLPPPVAQADALAAVMRQAALLDALERRGALEVVVSAARLRGCLAEGRIAAVMHLEGAEAIDRDLDALHTLRRAGLRSLGPVWSRPTIWGEGVPFRFPSSPDIGPGLTEDGRRLVRACAASGIMVDLSHLNEAGFWDVARLEAGPLVATHSNAHALCPHARNLTNRQLDAIADSDGMVGLNFATAFLRADGRMDADTPIETMIRHLDHLIGRLGEDRVGFGSDFDGATVPRAIGDAAGLPVLRAAMRDAGWGAALVEKLCWRNWARLLERAWGG